MISRLKAFLQESKFEFRRINWPSGRETMRLTVIVVALSVGTAVFLGILDFIFSNLLRQIL